jgi:hypothetical protein
MFIRTLMRIGQLVKELKRTGRGHT